MAVFGAGFRLSSQDVVYVVWVAHMCLGSSPYSAFNSDFLLCMFQAVTLPATPHVHLCSRSFSCLEIFSDL